MKIRIKLICLLLLILIIPLLVLSGYLTSKFSEQVINSQISSLTNSNSDRAKFTTEFLRNLNSAVKTFASNDLICRYTSSAAGIEPSDSDNEDLMNINKEIRSIVQKSDDITDMFIMTSSGKVIASYDSDIINTKVDNADELISVASENSGISHIYPPQNGNVCYFYIVRRVYSTENKLVGYVCQKIEFTTLGELIELDGYSDYATMMIIDSAGYYVTGSISTPKSIEYVSEYKGIAQNLADVIPFYGETGIRDTLTAEYDHYSVSGTVVPTGNWSVVTFYDVSTADAYIINTYTHGKLFITVITILCIAAVIYVCILFTNPIRKMTATLKNKSGGDTSLRLDIKSKDEFGEISSTLNSMFDRIYESEQRYGTVISMMENIVFEANLKTFKVFVSDNFNQKFSFRAKDDSISESFLYKIKVHKDDAKRYQEDLDLIISSVGDKWEGEYRLKNLYGDFSWIRIKGKKFMDRNNTPSKIIGVMVDIDREKKSSINLIQKASFDALTQLYNRPTFLRSLDEELSYSISRKSLNALMFIDLDDFKHFNDEYGHKCGDEVLKFVADTIKEITYERGFGGRLGGDEFVMCLTNLHLIGDSGKIAAEMIKILNNGFISESTGETFNIHCSIGIAFFRENGMNSTELLEAADTAMYKIKKSGKSNYAYAGGDSRVTDNLERLDNSATFDDSF